jgi:hypothetical protein
MGTLAAAAIPFVPSPPKAVAKPEPERIIDISLPTKPDKAVCRDFAPQVTIQEYKVGGTINYQDLRFDDECEMCMYEDRCMCSGKAFEKYGDGSGRFIPEQFNKRLQNTLYRKLNFTGDKA